ncbi:DUF4145 domain-containing protein [Sphingobacterium hungaricum]|uniref:DUF4145 domain-containing protein n=1 Tax=Sphingobacterium hungaricum TaxID=2082723 RepID=A0A928V295_9SPHI|nr:DUF4145 domain-containing protein [Sphingobacterium hungaricum]MBE8714814.1 hypothetical protein [Sphingobacterium hungaricum]
MKTNKVFCNSCKKETNHNPIFSNAVHDEELPDEEFPLSYHYWGTTTHILLQCLGCDDVIYCRSFHDPSMVNEINEELIPYSEKTYYPPFAKMGFASYSLINKLPNKIANLYQEVKIAIENKAFILASAGLRAIIEGTYIDKKLSTQRDLEQKIHNLSDEGLLTKNDAHRLHSIRFLGNNAIHELDKPKEKQIRIALDIVNHYLKTIYYPDDEVLRNLDIQINTYQNFVLVLTRHITLEMVGHIFTLKELIPKINKICKPNDLKRFTSILDKEISDKRLRFLEQNGDQKYKVIAMNFFLHEDPYDDLFTKYN